jgi:hypothetical protein
MKDSFVSTIAIRGHCKGVFIYILTKPYLSPEKWGLLFFHRRSLFKGCLQENLDKLI